MIAREGYPVIGLTWILAALAVTAAAVLPLPPSGRTAAVAAIILFLGIFPLYFFRDPHREVPPDAHTVLLAPADGRVVAVTMEEEPHFLKGPARRVSIFLSPLNVHVNRIPAAGVIEYAHYQRGTRRQAWQAKASSHNEQSLFGVRHPLGQKILFKQIAGTLARRIVYHVSAGDSVNAGDRFGIIRFGSRLDVLVPLELSVTVKVGDRVRAGESVMGRMPEA